MASPPEYSFGQEDMSKAINQPVLLQQQQQQQQHLQVQLSPVGNPIPPGAYPPAGHGAPVGYPQAVPTTGYVVVQPQAPSQGSPGQSSYRTSAGVVTGSIQLCCGILAIIFSGASFTYRYVWEDYDYYSSLSIYIGMGIWSAILFFIPTGILGVFSKGRSTGVIVAYLVMCILAAVNSACMVIYESIYAAANYGTYTYVCNYRYEYTYTPSGYSTQRVVRQYCSYRYSLEEGVIALHSVLAIIAFVEFVVAIVGSAFCCGGLCCGTRTITTNPIYYHTAVQPQPALSQPQPRAIQVAGAQ